MNEPSVTLTCAPAQKKTEHLNIWRTFTDTKLRNILNM